MGDDFDADWAFLRRLNAPDPAEGVTANTISASPLEPRQRPRPEPYRPRPRALIERDLREARAQELATLLRHSKHVAKRGGEKLEEMHLDDTDSIPPV